VKTRWISRSSVSPLASAELRVIDQNRASATSLAEAMPRIGAIAGVNGGFFKPNFDPLGLVISQGQRTGTWQKSSLLGGVVVVKHGKPLLLWRDEFQDSPRITELLQAGPRLVNNGQAVTGLENKAARPPPSSPPTMPANGSSVLANTPRSRTSRRFWPCQVWCLGWKSSVR